MRSVVRRATHELGKVVTMKRNLSRIPAAGAALVFLVSCGGEDGDTLTNNPPPAATATPTPAATATATAAPTTAPTNGAPPPQAGGEEDDNLGPVTTVFTRVFVVRDKQGGEQIPGQFADRFPGTPYYNESTNNEMVPIGTFFILDTTPKNAEGKKCQADRPPQWVVDHGGKFEPLADNGIGSNKFQYRANARAKGVVTVYTLIDGVRSNIINVQIY